MMQENEQDQGLYPFFQRRWRSMLLSFTLVLAVGAIAFPFIPKKYQSTAKLIVMRSEQRMGGLQLLNDDLPELTGASHPLYTQAEMIRLDPVMVEASARLKRIGQEASPEQIKDSFLVEPIKGTDLIKLDLNASDPLRAKRMLSMLCDVYLEHIQRYRKEGVQEGLKYLEEQLASTRKQLNEGEDRLQAYKRRSGSVDLTAEIGASVKEYSEINSGIRARRLELEGYQARAAALRAKLGMSAKDALDAVAIAQNPRLKELQEQLMAANTSPLRSQGLTPDNPDMRALDNRVAMLKKALESEVRTLIGRKVSVRALDEVRVDALRQLIAAETDALSARASLGVANQNRHDLALNMSALPEREVQLSRLQREVEVSSQIYQQLLQKRAEAKLGLANNMPYAYVIEPASLPLDPFYPQANHAALMLVVMGLFLAYGVGILRDLFCGSSSPQFLLPDAPLYASLPILTWKERRNGELIVKNGTSPHYVEALKAFAMLLEQHIDDEGGKVIALTSVLGGEGKSVTIANLAWCLWEAGNRVLLIDGDTHQPSLHAFFKQSNAGPGLSEIFAGNQAPKDLVQKTEAFDLVKAGRNKGNVKLNRAILKQGLVPLLTSWRKDYDIVLIDLPPLQVFSEVAQIAKSTDGLLLLANTQKVSWNQLASAVKQLQAVRVPIVGLLSLIPMIAPSKGRGYLLSAEGSRE